nr:MAG TPA: hypothetical protein [Caudoviricetes sp.]
MHKRIVHPKIATKKTYCVTQILASGNKWEHSVIRRYKRQRSKRANILGKARMDCYKQKRWVYKIIL